MLMNRESVPDSVLYTETRVIPSTTGNGLVFEGPGWSALAGRRAMIAKLSNQQRIMVRLLALDPYGHWNFKPPAADMWAFFSRFRRDPATGALEVLSTQ